MAQHLLAAADRFQLIRLRCICEQRLCETVEVRAASALGVWPALPCQLPWLACAAPLPACIGGKSLHMPHQPMPQTPRSWSRHTHSQPPPTPTPD